MRFLVWIAVNCGNPSATILSDRQSKIKIKIKN